MSVERVERAAVALASMTRGVEAALLASVAAAVRSGTMDEAWAAEKLARLGILRRSWDTKITAWLLAYGGGAQTLIGAAADAGYERALGDLRGIYRSPDGRLPGAPALGGLVEELTGVITSTRLGILRTVEDAYRGVIAAAQAPLLLGVVSRRAAAQMALDRFAARGITGFTDRAGRRWDLASYAEMATRTVSQRAMVQAHTVTLQGLGVDLVMVSDAPQECKLCRPWEGKVLTLTGSGARTLRVRSAISEDLVTVRVAGSLAEARQAGLMHPNCRHSVSAFLPGVTRRPDRVAADPAGDKARTRLRELERGLRAAKRRELVALDPPAKTRALADIRARQAQIREHVATTSAKRRPSRERIDRAR